MAPRDLLPGTVVGGRYRLQRLLGEGGMGVVWEATEVATGARRALKLMKEVAGDPEARRRLLREGRAAGAVRHPHVVAVLDVIDEPAEPPALVMELLEGEPLRARLQREGRLALGEAADVLVPVVSAVGAAHALGVIHRDLKPENIFLARGEGGAPVVKVLDFGIAKLTALDGEVMRSTGITTGVMIGTPAYMAPEQVFAEKDLDHRVDVWALGIILYECLSGECPTAGESVGQVLKHVVARPFEPLARRVPGLPPEVAELVERMLAHERDDRPGDLLEVQDVLEGFATAPGLPFEAPARRPVLGGGGAPTRRAAEAVALPAPPPPPKGRWRRRAAVGSAAAAGLVGALALWAGPGAPASEPSSGAAASSKDASIASPLDPADSKLACPALRASGVAEPAGWLGAAAAAVACERAAVLLGGLPERTLAPAELLDLEPRPADRFPDDPYGQPGARERAVAAAAQRAQAYLDGEVVRRPGGFAVRLALRRPDGGELARGAGQGQGLYEAVRAAMGALVGPGRIPRARALHREAAAWARTADVDDALGVLDLAFAVAHNAGGLPDECQRFEALSARVGELGVEGRWLCAYTLGRPAPAGLSIPSTDLSNAARVAQIRLRFSTSEVVAPEDVAFLRALLSREGAPRERSLIAATLSCLLGASDPDQARALAILAVQHDPRNPEGAGCNPWEQLMTLERDTAGVDSRVRAMQAWLPWNSYAWLEPGFRPGGREPAALPSLWRAHILSPLDAQIASTLAGSLLAAGDREAARGVAATLSQGGLPLHEVERELILARVDTSEARFGAALARARRIAAPASGDSGWVRAQRFEAGWLALELASLLGRAREVADELVGRFLGEPAALDGHASVVPIRVPALCALASAPARCCARFRALRAQLPGAITRETDDFLAGVERYSRGDLAGAAAAFRPLLAGNLVVAGVLPGVVVEVLERTGAGELADRVDQEEMKRAGELGGATLGHARAARRALARGDRATARRLAEQVIEAWARADQSPPALAEARRLAAQLGPP